MIKEKLNCTRFDWYFFECCFLCFVVAYYAIDGISSGILNLVTDSPTIVSLQVMMLAKNSSRTRFCLKAFYLGVRMRNNENELRHLG